MIEILCFLGKGMAFLLWTVTTQITRKRGKKNYAAEKKYDQEISIELSYKSTPL